MIIWSRPTLAVTYSTSQDTFSGFAFCRGLFALYWLILQPYMLLQIYFTDTGTIALV